MRCQMKDLDKYRGCLIGGAVGDILGYAVEFIQDYQIFQRYGEQGITEFSIVDGVAPISDDTQMTRFTATGLLVGTTRDDARNNGHISILYIFRLWRFFISSINIRLDTKGAVSLKM